MAFTVTNANVLLVMWAKIVPLTVTIVLVRHVRMVLPVLMVSIRTYVNVLLVMLA